MRPWILYALLWLITKVERHKSRALAWYLHALADEYDPRPTGAWAHRGPLPDRK